VFLVKGVGPLSTAIPCGGSHEFLLMRIGRALKIVLGLAACLFFCSLPSFPKWIEQMSGTITAQGGGPVAGATVTVTDVTRGEAGP